MGPDVVTVGPAVLLFHSAVLKFDVKLKKSGASWRASSHAVACQFQTLWKTCQVVAAVEQSKCVQTRPTFRDQFVAILNPLRTASHSVPRVYESR